MTPDISRRLGRILGLHWSTPEERGSVIVAAQDATSWEDIPRRTRELLDEIAQRPVIVDHTGD